MLLVGAAMLRGKGLQKSAFAAGASKNQFLEVGRYNTGGITLSWEAVTVEVVDTYMGSCRSGNVGCAKKNFSREPMKLSCEAGSDSRQVSRELLMLQMSCCFRSRHTNMAVQ